MSTASVKMATTLCLPQVILPAKAGPAVGIGVLTMARSRTDGGFAPTPSSSKFSVGLRPAQVCRELPGLDGTIR